MLALAHPTVLPSAMMNDVGTPIAIISQLNTLPALPPVNASMAASRLIMHDSGSGWLAMPFLYDSFIHYSTPVVLKTRGHSPASRYLPGQAVRQDLHCYSQAAETAQVMMSTTLPTSLVRERLGATKRHSGSEHAVNNDQHMMCDRHNGTLWSEALYEQSELRFEHGSLPPTGGPRTLYQCGSQILVAMSRLAAFPDACALTVPWA